MFDAAKGSKKPTALLDVTHSGGPISVPPALLKSSGTPEKNRFLTGAALLWARL